MAPHLNHKSVDAPVISVAESGRVVVPLIGGHHGAIVLAQKVSEAIDADLALTTAGDGRWRISLDEPPSDGGWPTRRRRSVFMPQLLAGDGAFIDGDCLDGLNDWFEHAPRGTSISLTVTRRQRTPAEGELVYCPQDVMLGAGCARGCPADELIDLVMRELARANVNAASIAGIFSVDLKADEPALEALADMLAVPLRIFDRDSLQAEAPRLQNPSDAVQDEIGIPGVAEAAALAAAGPEEG